MIYIASPFSDSNKQLEQERFEQVRLFTSQLMTRGLLCFSPIVYGMQFYSQEMSRGDAAYWRTFNDHMLRNSHALLVYTIPGWKKSIGVRAEIAHAKMRDLPIAYADTAGKVL